MFFILLTIKCVFTVGLTEQLQSTMSVIQCMYLPYTVDCLRTCFCYRPESSVFVNCVSHSTFKRNFVAYIKW